MSLLFITHDLSVVSQIADQVAVIRYGEILEQASTQQFFEHPQQEYSQQLFEAVPSWDESQTRPRTAENRVLLKVDDLKIYFPIQRGIFQRTVGYVKAVDGISFQLYKGRTLALVGESGSGKTTAARGILQLIKPTMGKVQFQATELTTLSAEQMRAYRRYLQIIFQDPYSSMDPRMLIGDILQEGLAAQHIGKNNKDRQLMIDDILQRVDLSSDMKDRYPHEFSGGQRQRICIARSLVMRPQIIICDEPTSALDIIVQMQILKLLRELQNEFHLSYLLITHNFNVVADLADEVAVMYHGKIIEQGDVDKILFHPQQSYTQKLIQSTKFI
jgi:peptide/nickel transport system ATP-binding protein